MKFMWRSPEVSLEGCRAYESAVLPGVSFAIRTASLGQRIELARRTEELIQRNEFLRGGSSLNQVQAEHADLLAKRLFLEWGLQEISGLRLNGKTATVESLIENGPLELCNEVVDCIRAQMQLSEAERKNS